MRTLITSVLRAFALAVVIPLGLAVGLRLASALNTATCGVAGDTTYDLDAEIDATIQAHR